MPVGMIDGDRPQLKNVDNIVARYGELNVQRVVPNESLKLPQRFQEKLQPLGHAIGYKLGTPVYDKGLQVLAGATRNGFGIQWGVVIIDDILRRAVVQ